MRACLTRGKKDKRKLAFSVNNPEASRMAHDEIAMEANTSSLAKEKHKKYVPSQLAHFRSPIINFSRSGAYIKSMVYGGLDGTITTFAVSIAKLIYLLTVTIRHRIWDTISLLLSQSCCLLLNPTQILP